MTTQTTPHPDSAPKMASLKTSTVILFAFACGATTANVYYSQSIAGLIASSMHLPASLAGLIVTTTQLGYGMGLFFLVCLADLIENRRLVLMTTAGTILSLIGVAISSGPAALVVTSFLLGVCTVGSQVLVPLAVHLSPERKRGKIIGNIMFGLVSGIMLSRPLASFLAGYWGWRSIFVFSAALMLGTFVLMMRALPQWHPQSKRNYWATLRSMLNLLITSRTLQRRVAYQGTIFGIFNMFWTAAPPMLHLRFGLAQAGIAAFALAGAAGALSAPVAGKVADRGGAKIGTGIVIGCAGIALLMSGWGHAEDSLMILVFAAIILDAATQANQVFGQRAIQSLDTGARGRLNAAYMTVIFICGAVGSALGSFTFYHGGWSAIAVVGACLAMAILLVFMTELLTNKSA
ncbi:MULTISPECIES: MFS transporter [Erwinia]|uniref:MFS transporter n=1 Tax=Erwinia TaxID=551 RepID=UPI00148A07E3|nr:MULTISPECIES: MFS transporter [Erwinia]MCS3609695.1 putative MFS family arabinose efflux permease [Erwinia rhapontici]NNS09697.1 MFS transporter [Erwinia sp. JH02]